MDEQIKGDTDRDHSKSNCMPSQPRNCRGPQQDLSQWMKGSLWSSASASGTPAEKGEIGCIEADGGMWIDNLNIADYKSVEGKATEQIQVEHYACRELSKEDQNAILNKHRKSKGSLDHVFSAVKDPLEKPADSGNKLLNDIDRCWESIGNVFSDYSTIDSKSFEKRVSEKVSRKVTLQSSNGSMNCVHVEGIRTKIHRDDMEKAFKALCRVGASNEDAQNIVTEIVEKKIKELF